MSHYRNKIQINLNLNLVSGYDLRLRLTVFYSILPGLRLFSGIHLVFNFGVFLRIYISHERVFPGSAHGHIGPELFEMRSFSIG